MGGYASLPFQPSASNAARNPVLDNIDRAAATGDLSILGPSEHEAIKRSGVTLSQPQAAAPTAPAITTPRPAPPSIAPVPQSPTQQADTAELARITAPPPSDPSLVHTHANTGTSGVNQIHNPWARIPLQIASAIGAGFAPGLTAAIPGTDLHHQALVNQQRGIVRSDEAQREGEEKARLNASTQAEQGAQTEHLGAETNTLIPAQANHLNAEAWATLNPQDKEHQLNEFLLWHQQNPQAPVSDWIKLKEGEGKAPTNAFELWHKQNPDKPAEEWLKIEAGNKPETMNEYADFKKGYLAKHPNASGDEVVRAYAAGHQAPERPPQALMVVPGENGAPGRAVNVTAGSSVPAGAITPSGISSETVAANKTAETERKAREELAKEYQVSRQLAANPSATNDVALLMRFIGSTKPDSLGKLRLNQQEMNLVMGTRGTLGDLEALAQKVQNGQRLTPQQRNDMLSTMALLAGQPNPSGGGSGAVPNVGENFQGGKVLKVTKIK